MTDITANVVVSMPSQLFTMARSFKAVANGKIYIGQVDTDPVNPENQIQVYVESEDGSHVPVSQPIIINAAGYPVYNGQIAKFVTVQNHSMAVYDAYGAQQFYYPDLLKYSPDQLRAELSGPDGASLVGYGDETVKDALDNNAHKIDTLRSDLAADDGFRHIGNFLNLEALRDSMPLVAGEIVYVASAASATATEKHYGGGYFQSFDNSTSQIADDGGIVIVPSTGTLAWHRINFTAYDMQFWGVKPDGATDNAEAITKATQYAKANHVELVFPAGNVTSSQAFPFYSRMSVRGAGRESSFFSKTTNNKFTITPEVAVDALIVFLPDVYDPSGVTMDTFCFKPKLEGITFQRDAVTASNMCYYSVWAEKLAAPVMRDLNFIGHYIGMYGKNWFLFEATSVQFLGISGRTYEGINCANVSGSTYSLSGTSLNWHLVSVVNAQIGYDIAGQQYSHLDTCTAEGIKPIPGETLATAFRFTNPTSITLTSCGTESVQGEQFRVEMKTTPSYKGSVVITNFQTVDQVNPATPTKFFVVDSAGAGTLSVSLIGGELTRNTLLSNLQQPTLSGSNCVLSNVGCWVESPSTYGGAVYKAL
ncbi:MULTISPECIES: phage head-binding domain-containing protein [Escherichia]|uniref:phage head-binding domain-containing protein n=1 Tax=Escherichia TaxID=561 RepID=UPI001E574377|nr:MULTISPECIES: phage head-binding domain-containing protein [Escherichia]MEC9607529.1 phage head-binding domain-containing protein [Escherichia marmotae]MED0233734.1 phage head-binding domain-containing protein [Escherichia marmotae]MED0538855.1 phage head-binding domain-containing protein [Escherichia marmotae]MED8761173.1 phage head-binding domain-containing protein [Escherichia marmotae]MED8802482.1 phage head-binding domain-containing protein [Escherichia marmotae]